MIPMLRSSTPTTLRRGGLNPKTDAIAIEMAKVPYANIIVVRTADKDQPWVKISG